jgi:hypothetical protein
MNEKENIYVLAKCGGGRGLLRRLNPHKHQHQQIQHLSQPVATTAPRPPQSLKPNENGRTAVNPGRLLRGLEGLGGWDSLGLLGVCAAGVGQGDSQPRPRASLLGVAITLRVKCYMPTHRTCVQVASHSLLLTAANCWERAGSASTQGVEAQQV